MDATILVQRKSSFIGMLRPFTVKVDGVKMAKVKNGQECDFAIQPGRHEIEIVGSLWAKSQVITVDAQAGQTLKFECGVVSKLVIPMIILSVVVFQLRIFAKHMAGNLLFAIGGMVLGIGMVAFAFFVSFRRNMMYYLERVS